MSIAYRNGGSGGGHIKYMVVTFHLFLAVRFPVVYKLFMSL